MDREELELMLKINSIKENPAIYQILEDITELTVCDDIRELDELFNRSIENIKCIFLDRVTSVVQNRSYKLTSSGRDESIRIQGGT